MAKLFTILLFAVCCAATSASALPGVLGKEIRNTTVIFATSDEIKDILQEYPKAIELQRRVQVTEESDNKDSAEPRQTVNYYLGGHTQYDYRVAYETDGFAWAKARDVQMTLQYPQQGVGKIVTFVDIYVTQSSDLGRSYAIDGGIGYRYITLVIEALQTYQFEYVASIYGED